MTDQGEEVLRYWTGLGPEGWYAGTDDIDTDIRTRFEELWRQAREDGLEGWLDAPRAALAALIVLDQFPRNMFRDRPESFMTDAQALRLAEQAIARGHDLTVEPPLRQFFYLPLMHAENIAAQTHCCALFAERMPGENLRHARAHRDVIARFGRFPWRNAALGRQDTAEELAFLASGGYASALADYPAVAG
ncbi:DUF924 domain-containing protein [Sinirhodobacter populi]|uniref:DUF924 domain-containing protein n=1 Tax=Paenirhodobacter populi TaxID=2306993 RepID=A0A443KMM8_9RHOB|nr:DUF924 family protein [Sinirhodobacter populi]RWR34058.1 DUF924 domain-containing protein [Sinirhodobacter populi]